jgi:hypothetical protein
MKVFPDIPLKPILDEIQAAFCQFHAAPVRIESYPRLSPIEIRRYIRKLRHYRQNSTR